MTPTPERAAVLQEVANRIASLPEGRPRRVAIDGITASGKTTFADDLASELGRRGLIVVRVSTDGFHNLRAVRYRQGRGSADGYYEDAYDFESIRGHLLDPLGPGGNRRYRSAIIDLATDTAIHNPPSEAPPEAVLVVDGSFLQKPVLRSAWDHVVYLNASFEAAAGRGIRRDAELLGGSEAAGIVFAQRYHAAQRRYLAECSPQTNADTVVDHEDPSYPSIASIGTLGGSRR